MTGPVYSQRPSKDVTRRIFVDALLRLSKIADPSTFQYVGLGALEFIDFDLIHRHLGIGNLVSIENAPNIERYESNKPYQCVTVIGGHTGDVLPRINWDGLSIVWLDYETQLTQSEISDISYLCSKLIPGSVLAVTLNAHPGSLSDRRNRLASNVGNDRVPLRVDDDTLGGWGWAIAQQRVLFSTVRNRLGKRVDSATWRQFLNIRYRDGARMQLVAGVISTPALNDVLDSCHFERLKYYRPGAAAIEIEVPYLTDREQSALRQRLPRLPRQRRHQIVGVDSELVDNYAEFYQWIGA